MKNIEKLLLPLQADIHHAIEKLDNNEAHIVLIVDENKRLVGTVTDGDVRRGILRGVSLSDSVQKIMNATPVKATHCTDKNTLFALMRKKEIKQIPLINSQQQVCGLEVLEEILYPKKDNIVVLMAGGLSTRLRPLTNNCPKPMLNVGGKPILETILMSLIEAGFHQFYIAINYLAEQIQSYFGNGEKWGVQIDYLREHDKMGTAGALSLLPPGIAEPILVMNSDLLTKVDFTQLLNFHREQDAQATMCVREFDYTVPYGICKLENNYIVEVVEKPTYKFFINAGVYVLAPKVLDHFPKDVYYDMPNFFSTLINLQQKTAAFPIREYWLDIGQLSDFERAHREYNHIFEPQEHVV